MKMQLATKSSYEYSYRSDFYKEYSFGYDAAYGMGRNLVPLYPSGVLV